MRNCTPLRIIAPTAFVFMSVMAHAAHGGIFNHDLPVPDWGLEAAKTHTPDYARDSPAVLLSDEYVETIDSEGRAVERERYAIRILQPEGRRQAECAVSYDVDEKINYFREWTIGADEKQYQAKDTDFVDKGDPNDSVMLMAEKTRIVHPPAADPGAIVICETEELLPPYEQEQQWNFQLTIPAVYQAFEVDLPAGRNYSTAWHRHEPIPPVQVSPGHWRWEVKDMKALDLRDVKATLEWRALAARMSVQWGMAAVDGADNQWRQLGLEYATLEAHRTDATPEITAEAQSLAAGAPDFYTKLKRVTEYIQKNVQYFVVERGIGGWQPHYASDIFRNRYGDCKDKTTLLISMLQVVGIHADYLPVDDRRGVVDPDAPSFYGNHMITAIEVPADMNDPRLMAIAKGKDGKRYLIFDPTNERVPVGNLPNYEQGSYGLLSAGDASQVLALPVLPPDANGMEENGTFALNADGTLTGKVDMTSVGPEGADFRLNLKYSDEKERHAGVERMVAHDLPGVTLDGLEFVQPPDLEKPLEIHVKVTVPQYAHTAGPLLLVRPRVIGEDAIAFDDKPRTLPIDLDATGHWHDSFDITLPAGYVVDDLPDPISIETDFGSYRSAVTAKGNVLHFDRELVVKVVQLPADKAAEFRKFEGTIVFDEKSAAVLKKQPTVAAGGS
ncbi:MAG: DUF3857 domain-containing protein [Terracidiphilus sp.]|jgi:hypothetical protein